MAITTGAELATAVTNWSARADLASRIPEFVALAEAKLNRTLRTPDMETRAATFSITGEYVALPTGFLEVRSFHLNNATKDVLTYMDPDTQTQYYDTSAGAPKFFAIVGTNFRFAPVPNTTTTATLVYYTGLTTVSTGGAAVNWLLTAHPDVYLYGALMEMAGYIVDDPRIPLWGQAYAMAVAQVKSMGARERWGGNSMAVRVA